MNNFNFYGPVYGDVSGFSTGHISNVNEPGALEKYAYWKKHKIWEDIVKDYEVGQVFEGLETLPFFLQEANLTFDHPGDLMPPNRNKIIHPLGTVA